MTENPDPAAGAERPPDPTPTRSAWTNGLLADSYVPLTDVEAAVAPRLLDALHRARIAAYLAETAPAGAGAALRLYVASSERVDARGIVAAVVRAAGATDPVAQPAPADPLAGFDTDAAFAQIVADWHVDTHLAIREAEKQLNAEDEDWRARLHPEPADEASWLDEDHYVPPPPPPFPRPTVNTAIGGLLVAIAIVLLGFGSVLGLPFEISLFLGVTALLTALGMLVMRLRARPDDDDDGAML